MRFIKDLSKEQRFYLFIFLIIFFNILINSDFWFTFLSIIYPIAFFISIISFLFYFFTNDLKSNLNNEEKEKIKSLLYHDTDSVMVKNCEEYIDYDDINEDFMI